jgi:hypothetical protein
MGGKAHHEPQTWTATMRWSSLIPVCSILIAILYGSGASAAPPAAPSKAARAALDAAIDELRKEYAAYKRDPKQPLRKLCDYFAAKPNPAITPDAVYLALEQRIDPDPFLSAYVRWQLLSALPKEIDPSGLVRALEVYRQSPRPTPRYGLAEKEQQALDALLPKAARTDDVILTIRLESVVRAWAEQNRYIMAYRDEWYRRLPKTPPTFAAAFEDAFERQSLAAGAEDFAPLVIADVQNWLAVSSADQAQCAALAGLLAKLRDKEAPSFYASAAIRSGKLTWVKKTDSMDPRKKLTHLHQALVEAAQRGRK